MKKVIILAAVAFAGLCASCQQTQPEPQMGGSPVIMPSK